MNYRRLSGLLFILFPIIIQIPFNILVATYNYPDILREPVGVVMSKFLEGGSFLLGTWYVYALSIILFMIGIMAYEKANKESSTVSRIGLISAGVQFVALLRWTFLVPFLARAHASATSPVEAAAIENLFTMQHNFLGVGLGEHVGQLTMAIWTVLMIRSTSQNLFLKIVGCLSAVCFVVGLTEQLGLAFGFDAGMFAMGGLLGFILWSIWLIGFGITLLRPAK